MMTHRVLNRLTKCANVCYHKKQVFLWFTINLQAKLKKFITLFLRYLKKKKLAMKLARFHDGLFELEILEIFEALQSVLLKNETKNLKKDQVNKKLLDSGHRKRQT